MTHGELVLERVRLLIEQVRETLPETQGREARSARKIGVSESVLSKIKLSSKRRLEVDTLGQIIEATRIDPRFFFDSPDAIGSAPDHRDFIRQPRSTEAPPFWEEFKRWHRFGELTAAERDSLQTMITIGQYEILDWTDWIQPAVWALERRKRKDS